MIAEVRRELARRDDSPPVLIPLSSEMRLERLEREHEEVKYTLYALVGIFLFLLLIGRR